MSVVRKPDRAMGNAQYLIQNGSSYHHENLNCPNLAQRIGRHRQENRFLGGGICGSVL